MDRKLILLTALASGLISVSPCAKMLKTIVDFGGPRVCTQTTTWNPADKDTSITLSNGNLTAAKNSAASSWRSVRATVSHTTGKYYYEITIAPAGSEGNNWIGGVADATALLTNYIGSSTHGYSCQTTGATWYNGTNPGTCGITSGSGTCTYLQIALDLSGNLGWWKANCAANWNSTVGADPATGMGGKNLNIAGGSVAVYPGWSGFDSGTDSGTLHASACKQQSVAPSGFTPWG
jgi:hypothetical protein